MILTNLIVERNDTYFNFICASGRSDYYSCLHRGKPSFGAAGGADFVYFYYAGNNDKSRHEA